ncbi:uncharacterized protein LOC109708518 [Ananas comosus]|uniref:Uncharacterized protein LOC109708518 n=1 Tax=Ananas comosus TaxID=4615 RepID=A0A6P5EQU1_ANACO|nr:uncharacterized protein LOC109708518 [Ananas comosus]
MGIDKSWIIIQDRSLIEYEMGVDAFLDYAFNQLGDVRRIRCPCTKCNNVVFKTRDEVKADLFFNGMTQSYTTWHHHGESSDESDSNELVDEDMSSDDGREDINRMVEDMFAHKGHAETSEAGKESIGCEQSNIDAQNYFHLLEECEQDAYPRCKKYSKLKFLVTLLNLKCLNGWTDKSVTMLLEFLKDFLPADANIPKSYYEMKNIIKDLGLQYIKIDACKNDCVLYRKSLEDATECPTCGESRWRVGQRKKNATLKMRKKIPHKVLRYFPLTPLLQRLYMNSEVATAMRWHNDLRPNDGILRHPADSMAWKSFDLNHSEFSKEPRNVRLGLATDGFNPFGNMSTSYSIWPVVLVPYNLPPWMCMKSDFFMISLIIPGPKALGNDIDVYMAPLIEELTELWETGVETYDLSKKENFKMRAAILWTISDFPTYANLSGWSTKGKLACPCCNKDTASSWLRHGKKFCYMGHRRFLPPGHKWREDKKLFNGEKETQLAPKVLSGNEVLEQLNQFKQVTFGKGNKKRRRGRNNECYLNWRKHSIFFDLPYWHTLLIRHNLDVMHIEKNLGDNIISTLMDNDGKSKDNLNARMDLMEMGIRKELYPIPIKASDTGIVSKYKIPAACYTMSKVERLSFCNFLKNLKLPDGFSSNISKCVNMSDGKLQNMKTHDYHCLLHRHLPLGIRGLLKKDVSNALVEFSAFFRELCSKSLKMDDLERLERSVAITLCKLEKIFPPAFFDIMVHLAIHLASEAKIAGPVQYRWMYKFERDFRRLKSYVRNKARPEGSIAEGVIAQECLTFCSRYLKGAETRLNRVGRNYEGESIYDRSTLSVFSQKGSSLGEYKRELMDISDLRRAHMYVLKNCPEVIPFIREHRELVEGYDDRNIDKRHEEQFSDWFEDTITIMYNNKDGRVSTELLQLARGPDRRVFCYSGYLINGFRFHTKEREETLKSQNSGVWVQGDDGYCSRDYFGQLLDIIELQYQGSNKVFLFKCHWWDVCTVGRGYREDNDGFFAVNTDRQLPTNAIDPYVLASQAQQVYYVEDINDPKWHFVIKTRPRDLYDIPTMESNEVGVQSSSIMEEIIQEAEIIGNSCGYMNIEDEDDGFELIRNDTEGITIDADELNIDLLNINDSSDE